MVPLVTTSGTSRPAAAAPMFVAPVDHPQAVLVLVFGVLGIGVLPLVAPFAWYLGNQALAEIDAEPGRYGAREQVRVGRLLGIIGTGIMVAAVTIALIFLLVFIVTAATDPAAAGESHPLLPIWE